MTQTPPTAQAAGRSGTRRRVRQALTRARTLWRDMTGESAYDRYLERYAREHTDCPNRPAGAHGPEHGSAQEPGHGPMSEREFWRARARLREDNPPTGCC